MRVHRQLWLLCTVGTLDLGFGQSSRTSTWGDDDAKVVACFEAMDREPALAVVNAKFARRNPSAAQLGDPSFASEAEAEALRLRVQKTQPCRELRLTAVKAHRPLLEPAYITPYYQADQVFEYLTQGWIAYGEANRLAKESLAAFEQRAQAHVEAADDNERRSLAQTWLGALQRAHSEPPPSAPRRVTCRWRELNIACE